MSKDIELLTEIRDLLQVMAEPMLAARDKRFRAGVRKVVGNSTGGRKAVFLMDGTRTQASIAKETAMDAGNLTRLVKALERESLCAVDEKKPKLVSKLPVGFFEQTGGADE